MIKLGVVISHQEIQSKVANLPLSSLRKHELNSSFYLGGDEEHTSWHDL